MNSQKTKQQLIAEASRLASIKNNSAHLVNSCANLSIDNNNSNLPSGANLSLSTLSHICSMENTAVSIDNTEINENTNASVALFSNEEVLPSGANFISSSQSPSSLIYATNNIEVNNTKEILINTGTTEVFTTENDEEIYAQFATFFKDSKTIYIPKKAEYNIRKYVSRKLLQDIDKNETIAIEKCLIFLNNLSSLFFDKEKEYKVLNAELLHEQLKGEKDNTYVYTKVVKALLAGTKQNGSIIEILSDENDRHIYGKGISSKKYKLTDTYLKCGITKYDIKTNYLINRRTKQFFNQLDEANENVIAKNLLKLYRNIELPTCEEILEEGKRLSKEKTTTKKGKVITYRNKRSDDKFKDIKKHSFVEDNIEMFNYLTSNGYMVPVIGDERSGGRVVDSFNLMPSWIRNLVKLDDEQIVEVDFKALHPNLAMKIYNGNQKYITHNKVSENASIDLTTVKVEHLSFFNKEVWQMKQSPLYSYYEKNEPEMLNNILQDKYSNDYKVTSRKMFKLEVEIMTETINRLNKKGIYVGYVYDALFCKESDAKEVADMMNEVAIEFGVYTTADYKGAVVNNDNSKVEQDITSIEIEAEMVAKIDMKEEYVELIEDKGPELDLSKIKVLGRTSKTKFDYYADTIEESKEENKPMSAIELMRSLGFK